MSLSPYIEPKYPLGKILTGQYTVGNEYVEYLNQGRDYIGLYHVLPNNEAWSETVPTPGTSKLLIIKKYNFSDDVRTYNDNSNSHQNNYKSPAIYFPILTAEDYRRGKFLRYFVQKRNNPMNTIIEISPDDYYSVNSNNKMGINGVIWNAVQIEWHINSTLAENMNRQAVEFTSAEFVGMNRYIKNFKEFVK